MNVYPCHSIADYRDVLIRCGMVPHQSPFWIKAFARAPELALPNTRRLPLGPSRWPQCGAQIHDLADERINLMWLGRWAASLQNGSR